MDDILVSSLKTTETRLDYWYDIRDNLKQKFKSGQHYVDEDGAHDEGPLFGFISSHGPAVTATMAGPGLFGSCIVFEGIDMVFAVPYPLPWPEIAKEWITRKRPSGWPSQKLVNDVVADGCTLVPKGSTGSTKEDYEWRISFTGELRLVRNLPLVPRQILHVLKALVSEPQHELNQVFHIDVTAKIESFQFLNLMFRECELVDEKEWNPKKIAHMLFHVIDTYLKHFKQGHLSHYLIKSRNILEKFRDISPEERETLLYTLHRIRKNPLEQILQQKRYLRLKPDIRKLVFEPFVEEVKAKGSVSQKRYVNTLVAFVKAHLMEKSYSSAYIYAMDALQFYQRMCDNDMSDEEYMDLYFTIAISCHRLGRPDESLEFLEKLHIVMTGQSQEKLENTFGVRNYAELLVLFARTLLVYAIKDTANAKTNTAVQYAMGLYNDALKLDPTNMPIQIEQMNIEMQFGDTQTTENLVLSVMSQFSENVNLISQNAGNDEISDLHDIDMNDVEVIYDRIALVNEETHEFSDAEDSKINDAQFLNVREETGERLNDESSMDGNTVDTSQFDYLFGNSCGEFDQELPETYAPTVYNEEKVNGISPEISTAGENLVYNLDESPTADETLWMVGGEFMKDFYQMKAFEGIKMQLEVEIIRNRLEKRMAEKRQNGVNVNFAMLETLFEQYKSVLKTETYGTDTLWTEVVSDSHSRVIYSKADTLLLDDSLVNLFTLFDSTVIKIPDEVLAFHMYIQFCKRQGKLYNAKIALQEMEHIVQSLIHAFDYAIGNSLLSSHYKWFGDANRGNELESKAKESVLTSKDTVDPPPVKHQIVRWINDVFSTVALNEPYNRYLDDIFEV